MFHVLFEPSQNASKIHLAATNRRRAEFLQKGINVEKPTEDTYVAEFVSCQTIMGLSFIAHDSFKYADCFIVASEILSVLFFRAFFFNIFPSFWSL
jgi:hypothetical protein